MSNSRLVAMVGVYLVLTASNVPAADLPPEAGRYEASWEVQIPMRDGVALRATGYFPKALRGPAPCIFSLSPYLAHGNAHTRATYFASHGYPFFIVDARGRGNSPGEFVPLVHDSQDGYDVVEWLAKQPYCNGKVAMFGGSYEGYSQWATAKSLPPHLATFVPVASVGPGIDFPFFKNISYPYVMQWLILTSGHVMQDRIFADAPFWRIKYREWFESGRPFHELDTFLGSPSPVFQQWVSHPEQGPYWDAFRPSAEDYGQMRIPILTITGSYDADQWGALHYYREHLRNASPEVRARHFLVIGPWDHGGTLNQKAEFRGVKVAPAGLLDILGLHAAWYAWTMQDGPRPEFLQKAVAYYVMGAEEWRYADTLEEITTEERPYFLGSTQNATDVLNSGLLSPQAQRGPPDSYVYDPHDVSNLALNVDIDPDSLTDQRLVYAGGGRQLVYHTAPFETDTEISGFFRLSVWISIDRPDTDFRVTVHEIAVDGTSTQLAEDQMRARYREGLREPKVVLTRAPQRYDFTSFNFISRQIKKGSRLRLVIGPIHSIYSQRNYNGGGTVSEESIRNAHAVKVTVFHDRAHPSELQIPLGRR